MAFTGLFPHRDYCFVLTSADSSANVASSATVERSFALRGSDGTSVSATSYDATDTIETRNSIEGLSALHTAAVQSATEAKVVYMPDFDGDAQADYAVLTTNESTGGAADFYAELRFYLSAAGYSVAMPITTKSNSFFGDNFDRRIGSTLFAAGDVNGDGLTDLVLSHPVADTGSGTFPGGFIVYYGQAPGSSWYTATSSLALGMNIPPTLSVYGNETFGVCSFDAAVLGDFDGDNRDEVACLSSGGFTGGSPIIYGIDLTEGDGTELTGNHFVNTGGGTASGEADSLFTIVQSRAEAALVTGVSLLPLM